MRIFSVLLITILFSCGDSGKNDTPNAPNQNQSQIAEIRWVNLSASINLLHEEFNLLNPPDVSEEDKCFRMGHVLGRSYFLGDFLKRTIESEENISSELKVEILNLATQIGQPNFYEGCQVTNIEELRKSLSKLSILIQEL